MSDSVSMVSSVYSCLDQRGNSVWHKFNYVLIFGINTKQEVWDINLCHDQDGNVAYWVENAH